MCFSTTRNLLNSTTSLRNKQSMAFPGVVNPWPVQPYSQLHHPFNTPWNSLTPPHQAATSPLATNVHTTSSTHIIYQEQIPFSSPSKDSDQSPVNSSPVSSSSPAEPMSIVTNSTRVETSTVQDATTSLPLSSSLKREPSTLHEVVTFNGSAVTTAAVTQSSVASSPKKKRVRRKRCSTCVGCQRKDNCGSCSVCTNPNATNSVCKMRQCEELKRRPSMSCSTPTSFMPTKGPPLFDFTQNSTFTFGSEGLDQYPAPSSTVSPLKDNEPEIKVPPPKRKKRGNSTYKPTVKEPPPCGCPGSDEGIYYTHLGAASTPEMLREILEKRFSVTGDQLRLLEVTFCGIEAKTAEGCPTAEWIIRRKDKEELFCVMYRHHKGHVCDGVYSVIGIVLWDGLSHARALHTYRYFTDILPTYGVPTLRKCERNEMKSCSCQGNNDETRGCSYSFGCSWSVYYNGCKFARSRIPRKFRLLDQSKEEALERTVQALSTDIAPVYKWLAPEAYNNQVATQESGDECRLGFGDDKPFSGITACMDFCAHSHYDRHNMTNGGATVVCTILKKGILGDDANVDNSSEQLHVLPLYRLKDGPDKSVPGIEVRPVEGDVLEVGYQAPIHPKEENKPQLQRPYEQPSLNNMTPPENGKYVFPSLNLNGWNRTNGPLPSTQTPSSTIDPATPSPSVSNMSSGYGSLSSVLHTPLTPTHSHPLGHLQMARPPFQFPTSSDTANSYPSPNLTCAPSTRVSTSQPGGVAVPTPTSESNSVSNSSTVDGFKLASSGLHRLNGVNHPHLNAQIQQTMPGTHTQSLQYQHTVKQEPISSDSKPVKHSLVAVPGNSSCSTDSDSDCYILADSSPTTLQKSPPLPQLSYKSVAPESIVKSEQVSLPSPMNGEPVNGFSVHTPSPSNVQLPRWNETTHQLQRRVSFASSPVPGTRGSPSTYERPSTSGSVYALDQHSKMEISDSEVDCKKRETESKSKSYDRVHAIPGGVALALDHGSILIECAKKELHATTAINNPCRTLPTRLSIVLYQHKKLTRRQHGWYEEEEKTKQRQEENTRQRLLKESEDALMRFNFQNGLQPDHMYQTQVLAEGFAHGCTNVTDSCETSSECSDSLEYIYSLLDDEEEIDNKRPDMDVVVTHVPKAEPLSEVENPFYLELPLSKVDTFEQTQPLGCILKDTAKSYPFSYVSVPTNCTPTLTLGNSMFKPKYVLSGNFAQWEH